MFFLNSRELENLQYLKRMILRPEINIHYHIYHHSEPYNFSQELNSIFNCSSVNGNSSGILPLPVVTIAKIIKKEKPGTYSFVISGFENLKFREVDEVLEFVQNTRQQVNFTFVCNSSCDALCSRISRGQSFIYKSLFKTVDIVFSCPFRLREFFDESARLASASVPGFDFTY